MKLGVGLLALFFLATCLTTPRLGHSFQYGQTGGGSLAGQMTVTVISGQDGSPVEGAWVMVGPGANDPFTGNYGQTGPTGQIVFTNEALSGPQTLTVTGPTEAYRAFTLVDADAAAVTVPLEAFTVYDPGVPLGDTGVIVQGDVTNFNVPANTLVEVGVVRDPLDIEGLLSFDVERLYGPALTYAVPGQGTYDLPRNLYWPEQSEGGTTFPSRSPYKLRLEASEYYRVFCMRGRVGVGTLQAALASGNLGALLGALAYDRYGVSNSFQVVAPGPQTQNLNLDYLRVMLGFFGVVLNVSNLPAAGGSWPTDYSRQTFLLGLTDLASETGTGPLAPINLVKQNEAWAGGSYSLAIPKMGTATPPPGTIMGMAAATAFDGDGNPDPRTGVSATISRLGLVPASGTGNPGQSTTLDGFLGFVDYVSVEPPVGGRMLRFVWWLVEGADYIQNDLDVVAYVDCVPGPTGEEECPVGREREYRSTAWTVLLPAGETTLNLPALPPGAPRPLAVPADVAGVNYTADWKVAVYGLGNGDPFDFNNFVFATHRARVTQVSQRAVYFNVVARNPDPPFNVSPENGATGVSLPPTLQGSPFSDQDADAVHAASQWQVRTEAGSYESSTFDSGPDASNLTTITLPEGALAQGRYYWHVRYQDDSGRWSGYSVETSFQTGECTGDGECDDGEPCTDDSCEAGTCVHANLTGPCDDGQFCTDGDACVGGVCLGLARDCADAVSCTTDSCDETLDLCEHLPDSGLCDDGLWCSGTETCDPLSDCQAGTPVDCADAVSCTTDACNEDLDLCEHLPDSGLCSDGLWCNGVETCDPLGGCQAGTDPCPNDGLFCNGTELCDEANDLCLQSGDPCADGESCTRDTCREAEDVCENICNAKNPQDPCCENPACTSDPKCQGKSMPWLELLLLQ